jgi:hypothetical protein
MHFLEAAVVDWVALFGWVCFSKIAFDPHEGEITVGLCKY